MRNETERRRAYRPDGWRIAFALAVTLATAPVLGACENTIRGAERDAGKIFGTAGSSPATGQNPSPSNAKGGTWKNPE